MFEFGGFFFLGICVFLWKVDLMTRACSKECEEALRVLQAETWLTVYRLLRLPKQYLSGPEGTADDGVPNSFWRCLLGDPKVVFEVTRNATTCANDIEISEFCRSRTFWKNEESRDLLENLICLKTNRKWSQQGLMPSEPRAETWLTVYRSLPWEKYHRPRKLGK